MALTDESGMNATMLVSPAGGVNSGFGNGFGGDWGWIILLLLFACGGWGNGFGGNNFAPYAMNTGNEVQRGFDQSALMSGINGLSSGINGIQSAICNGFSSAEIAANSRQMADMNQMFALQSSLQNCCCENRANIADLKYTVATENCADRTQAMQNTRDIIDNQTRSTQLILDKLCQQEIDNLKAANIALQNQLNMANLAASKTAQTSAIEQFILANQPVA